MTINLKKAEKAIRTFLEAMGQDLTDPNLVDTPKRVTKMYAEEILSGHNFKGKLTTFETKDTGDQFVVLTNLNVSSMCSHHLMPIRGVAHVGAFFIADHNGMTRLPGLSKYARIVEAFSRQLQLQERLTNEITNAIFGAFNADFVYVVLDCEHYCMKHRGVEIHNSETITTSLKLSPKFKGSNFNSSQFINDFYNQLKIRMMK